MSDSSSDYESNEIFGNSILWCKGRIVTGKKYYHMVFSFLLNSLPFALLLAILIQINNNFSSIAPIVIIISLYLLTIFCLIRGGCTDPGILPRQNHHYFYNTKRPMLRQMTNGHMLSINYCYTCSLFRPPRTSHCAECDNCVERFDHHCLWLGTCIGRRNYKFFYFLLLFVNVSGLFHIAYSIYLIVYQATNSNHIEQYNSLVFWGLASVIFFDLIFILFFVGKLLLLHSFLAFQDLTFYEHIKKKWIRLPGFNPFFKSSSIAIRRLIFGRKTTSALDKAEEKSVEPVKSSEETKQKNNENGPYCRSEECNENGYSVNGEQFKSDSDKEMISSTERNDIHF